MSKLLYRSRQFSAATLVSSALLLISFLFVDQTRSASRTATAGVVETGRAAQPDDAITCTSPGTQVVTDPTGDQTGNPGANQQLDIQFVSIAEPCAGDPATNYLTFTMKVANLSSIPPNAHWKVSFATPTLPASVTAYYVEMMSDQNGNVAFGYGTVGTTTTPGGTADSGTKNADGTITITVANSKVGNPTPGQTLTKIQGATQLLVGSAGTGLLLGTDSTTITGTNPTYTLGGHASCTCPSATPTPTPAGTPGPGDPRFMNYTPPSTASYSNGEPSIGANWQTGNLMYLAGFNAIRISLNDCSSPARDTWTNASPTAAVSLDPILFTDHYRPAGNNTPNRTFVSQLTGQDSITFFTDNDGQSYLPSQGGGIPSGVDHQTIGAGPYHAPFPVQNPIYPNAVYYCSQDIAASFCARSDDGGITFGAGVPMYTVADCVGIHGHVKVAPDGTVYVPNRSCNGKAAVIVSKDNGHTWAVKPVPTSSTTGFLVDPSVGIGANNVGKPGAQASNTIYLGYQASDGHAHIAVSHDQGDTWGADQDVGAPLGLVNTTFPTVVGGDDNRASYSFFGTTVPGNYTDQANYPQNTPWHLYVATTFNAGGSWAIVDATPNDPVQRGSICNLGTTSCQMHSPNDRNLLDFMDATVDAQGRAVVGYPDGCVGACVNATGGAHPNSYTALASVARQSGGKRLFAAYDPNPAEPTVPAAPRVDSVTKDAANIVHLTWSAPDNGGSPITGYRIYRRTDPGTYGAPVATVPANVTSYDDAIPDPTAAYYYKVTALNGLGEGTNCNEYTISAPPPVNRCVVPGYLVTTDPVGDQTLGPDNNRDLDVQSVSISEPVQGDGINRLIFTMKVTDLSTIQPDRQWYMIWTPPTPPATAGTDRYYVAMKSNTGGAAAVTYEYGALTSSGNVPVKLGDADAGTFTSTGLIEIAIANSKVGNPGAGAQLNVISARNFAGTGDGTVTKSSAIDSTADGSYTLAGNAACNVNHAPIAALSTNVSSGVAPLAVTFTGAGSTDPDNGDSVASYTFDFGDGSAPVTQGNPVVTHTYNTNGSFNATLRVTDTKGQISDNVATAVIEVQSTLSGLVSRKTHGTAGTFDINLLVTGGQGVECRTTNGNGSYQLIFTFARPLTTVTSASVDRGNGTVSSRASDPSDAHQYIVNLSGVTDAQVIDVSLSGVQDGTGANMNVTVPIGILLGDINGDGAVNSADATVARNRSGQDTDSTNFRADVNTDGTVNSADATIVRNRSGSGFAPAP